MSRGTRSISATHKLLPFPLRQRGAVARDPADLVDVGDAPDLPDDLLYVLEAPRLEREPAQRRSFLDGVHPRREYVHPRIRDDRRYVLEEVHPVQGLDEQLHREELPRPLRPFDLYEALRVTGL